MKYITAALAALFPLVLSAQTYTNEVAAIINDNCVVCHRAGGIGPMSFETYEQVRPWAPLISLKVMKREMPPYAYDHGIGIHGADHTRVDAGDLKQRGVAAAGATLAVDYVAHPPI